MIEKLIGKKIKINTDIKYKKEKVETIKKEYSFKNKSNSDNIANKKRRYY